MVSNNKKRDFKLAKRRMFSIDIVESDAFCSLPASAQSLYFHLCMNADDDGFVDKWKSISRYLKVKRAMLDELLRMGLVVAFAGDVLLISDWHRHNTIKLDRYSEGRYKSLLDLMEKDASGRYFKPSGVFLDP
jgi:hypothetical protein